MNRDKTAGKHEVRPVSLKFSPTTGSVRTSFRLN